MSSLNEYKNTIKKFISNKNLINLFKLINCNSYFLLFYLNKLEFKNSLYLSNSIKNIKQDIRFLDSKIDNNTIFQKVSVKTNFKTFNINSTSFKLYYFIISKKEKKYVIDFVIDEEEFPILFKLIESNNNLCSFDYINLFFKEKFNMYISNSTIYKYNSKDISFRCNFNKKKAIFYAEKYSLKYNPEYESFDKTGGDCTNFASQIINYGNVETDYAWKPYTIPWIRVNELRDYLIYNNLAVETDTLSENSTGSLIQFFHPDKQIWSHTGFITYSLKNDFLYCCHSYDKLNYPLSLSYPTVYKKIRIITLY